MAKHEGMCPVCGLHTMKFRNPQTGKYKTLHVDMTETCATSTRIIRREAVKVNIKPLANPIPTKDYRGWVYQKYVDMCEAKCIKPLSEAFAMRFDTYLHSARLDWEFLAEATIMYQTKKNFTVADLAELVEKCTVA